MYGEVDKLIDALFENTVMDEETEGLASELRDNCRSRYDDMLSSGSTPEEALNAVRESLAGMDELVRAVAKDKPAAQKPAEPTLPAVSEQPADDTLRSGPRTMAPAGIAKIDVSLSWADLRVTVSNVPEIGVRADGTCAELIEVIRENDTLIIRQKKEVPAVVSETFKNFSMDGSGDKPLWQTLLEKLAANMQIIRKSGTVYLSLPASFGSPFTARTASGDITLSGLNSAQITLSSASGDINLTDVRPEDISVTTASGDIEGTLVTHDCVLHSASGDITLSGIADSLAVDTASGDVSLYGVFPASRVHTMSGDVKMELAAETPAPFSADLKTMSGDVDLRTPGHSPMVTATVMSGDSHIRYAEMTEKDGRVTVRTMSGDVTAQ